MTNKVIIGILVFLLVITGGLGAYSVNLGKEIGAFRQETAAQLNVIQGSISGLDTRVTALGTEVTAFKTETAAQFSESTINARKISERVIKGVCEITDGKRRLGSGFVFDARGYIVTNHHVVDKVAKIDVILHDGSISKASIVGSDKYSDVAVLKLERKFDLEPLSLADSNTVVNGEPIIAVGSPFGLPETVNSGIVSRKKGAIPFPKGDWWVFNLIQFDAATNPGNSGSPVVNSKGEVVGMAAYLMFPTSGIAWAITSNKVKRVSYSIIDHGSFKNAILPGTWRMTALTPEAARARGLETGHGALFAEAKGVDKVETNDIVVAVDGIVVKEPADLFNYIGEYKSPGDTIKLTLIIRGGIKIEVPVKLVEGYARVVRG